MFDTEAKNKCIDFKIYKTDLSIFVIFASSAEFSSKSTLTDARGFKKNQMNLQPLAGIIRIKINHMKKKIQINISKQYLFMECQMC